MITKKYDMSCFLRSNEFACPVTLIQSTVSINDYNAFPPSPTPMYVLLPTRRLFCINEHQRIQNNAPARNE